VLVYKQFRSSSGNCKKGTVVFLGGVVGFCIIQLLFAGFSFIQMPKNVKKYMKCPDLKIGYQLLIWEDENKMEDNINEFFDDLGYDLKYEHQKDE